MIIRFQPILIAIFFVVLLTPSLSKAQLTPERKAQLEAELVKVEKEIEQNKALVAKKSQETASISRDVAILNAKLSQARLSIKAKKLEIQRLGGDINKKKAVITSLDEQIEEDKLSLAELLRKTRKIDETDVTEIVLSNDSLSDIFTDLDSFSFIQQATHQSFANIRLNQNTVTKEKIGLESRRNSEIDAQKAIEKEERNIASLEAEKKRILSISKTEESAYRSALADREAERARIRSALFNLRDSGPIQFGQALDIATQVGKMTGVRPAFILAIITQESNLGANVGTCNRPGDPPEKHWTAVMHPTRDLEPFKAITSELGINPEGQPVSCPYGGGYGGAMGPSQFIPSTWVMYKDKVANITGNHPANPWVTKDAFTATSLLVRDLGASAQTYTGERTAALRYYAGGNWANPKNAFYGDSVMRIATNYQNQIDILQNN